jgi:GNAT superfamily N-acetyltransferase
MAFRRAQNSDLDLLAEWNHQLIADEGHRNPMTVSELRERMRGWLATEYEAIVFFETTDVAYALFRETDSEIYLRQFFVRRDRRREGIGKRAVSILLEQVWPATKRLTVDVLVKNEAGIGFWHAVGFRDYSVGLEIPPRRTKKHS